MLTFSMQLYATRDIPTGFEILTAYCDITGTTSERRKDLHKYAFQCSCPGCQELSSYDSDTYRAIISTPKWLIPHLEWCRDPTLRNKDEVTYICHLKGIAEKEGLEAMDGYKMILLALLTFYITWGDEGETKKWSVMLGRWIRACEGDLEYVQHLDRFGDMKIVMSTADWGIKTRARVAML